MGRRTIKIIRRGKIVEIDDFAPDDTLLDYLRLKERACGCKEGCGEGDCGACTVAVGELRGAEVHYRPVNACIQFLAMLDGREIVTVEDLASKTGSLHPVQAAMLKHHASQCGFCTPGFVMSLFTLYHEQKSPDREQVVTALAGNLCRCTGYRPIIDAALQACAGAPDDEHAAKARNTARLLAGLQNEPPLFAGDQSRFFAAPHTQEELIRLLAEHDDAVMIAGASDMALQVTKKLRRLPRIISVSRIKTLAGITDSEKTLEIGAGVTYAAAQEALGGISPKLAQFITRIGSPQIRASGTIGGNIANGSPIGDMPPVLIALGAWLHLSSAAGPRSMKLEDYFIAYGRQDRAAGEFISHISVPRPEAGSSFSCYKIAKRFDQDISALCGAFLFSTENNIITAARIAYGGMAETPKLALKTQKAVSGANLADPQGWPALAEMLEHDFTPINDMRAGAGYRMQSAKALLLKALHSAAGMSDEHMSIYPPAEASHAKRV